MQRRTWSIPGAQSIELCGGLGSKVVAEVIEATGGRVPVGGVTYGVESVHALAALFPQADEPEAGHRRNPGDGTNHTDRR